MQETRLIKTPFSRIVIFAAVLLMTLPFITTINSFLTNVFLRWHFYSILQSAVVPYEAKVIWGIFNILGFAASAGEKGVWINGLFVEITWNCLGWQSAVFLLATFLGGFQGKFSWVSRLEVVAIGVLGTFLINIFRIALVGILATNFGKTPALFFHDNLVLVFVILWFVFFWWFSYSFVLEEMVEKG